MNEMLQMMQSLPLLLAELVVLLLVILVPSVSTFIPNFFGFAN